MIDEGMKITPLPEIKIKKDLVESQDFFGRTAYYDPNVKEIVLYTEGRHPKDILRSFSHEMVHHMQNLENRMGVIRTSNTNESEDLLELEKEAYLTGNITFRNWEDKIKNGYEKS
jgi:succinate dehydrogenase/fumarate reductase-like Fe-S protein